VIQSCVVFSLPKKFGRGSKKWKWERNMLVRLLLVTYEVYGRSYGEGFAEFFVVGGSAPRIEKGGWKFTLKSFLYHA
jgi:hypothetical protein